MRRTSTNLSTRLLLSIYYGVSRHTTKAQTRTKSNNCIHACACSSTGHRGEGPGTLYRYPAKALQRLIARVVCSACSLLACAWRMAWGPDSGTYTKSSHSKTQAHTYVNCRLHSTTSFSRLADYRIRVCLYKCHRGPYKRNKNSCTMGGQARGYTQHQRTWPHRCCADTTHKPSWQLPRAGARFRKVASHRSS